MASSSARICVFCGSHRGTDPAHTALAEAMGQALVAAGAGLVYGGGSVGLMGVLADSVMSSGGEVTGVIPGGLFAEEVAHQGVTELIVVRDMHERKRTMYSLADGFATLPGGLGTLEELFEVATWNQLGLHDAPRDIALVDSNGFWRPLVELLDATVTGGFARREWRERLRRFEDPTEAVGWLVGSSTR